MAQALGEPLVAARSETSSEASLWGTSPAGTSLRARGVVAYTVYSILSP